MTWLDARRRAHAAAGTALPAVEVPVDQASGRRLARDVRAAQDIPHYRSSAMDGWLVGGMGPWRDARPIVTGAAVPDGPYGVLPIELGEVRDGVVWPLGDSEPQTRPIEGRHVRPTGTEARTGDILISAGTVLNPAHLAIAAACGVDALTVAARPRVALLLTGDEVDEVGVPAVGRVRDSFRPLLPPLLRAMDVEVGTVARVADTLGATIDAISAAAPAHGVLVTTGGTGPSSADHLRPALARLGATSMIERIAMRPGAPTLLARLPDGTWIVALPGNPFAAVAGLMTVGLPLLEGMAGRALTALQRVVLSGITASSGIEGRGGRTQLIPARIVDGHALPTGWRGSAMLRGLADADVLLVIPEAGATDGESVDALPVPWQRQH